MVSMKPLIGITTGEIRNMIEPWSPITYGQSHTYSDAIIRAGGLPVLLPITNDAKIIMQTYSRLDGILFAGGNDINPKLYGQKPYTETTDYSPVRDQMEINLMYLALEQSKSILAICRGMQLLNVVCGGSLYQHIKSDLKQASDHEISTRKKTLVDLAHQLKVKPKSKLAAIIHSDTIAANTHHHQAINRLGDNLIASAHSEDNLIEAIEGNGKNYMIGIQCHPESLSTVEPKWDLVFSAFVESARA
jgi:putative glutamine amidotransferase